MASRPSRARGLKRCPLAAMQRLGKVAPLAGAWIETLVRVMFCFVLLVAPLAGAWIETKIPAWVAPLGHVAPLAGAWIETRSPS